jgi:hypothetical protein
MSRRLVLLASALSFVSGIAMLGSLPAHTADSTRGMARVGFVDPGSASTSPEYKSAFLERMRELGWVEGQNLGKH